MSRKVIALRAAADKARSRGDQEELARLYVELERADPNEPEWPKRAADAYQRLRQPTEEFDALLRAARSYSEAGFLLKAVAVCKRILRLDPNHTETQMQLAELHSGRKRGLQRVVRRPEQVAAHSPHIYSPAEMESARTGAPTPDPPSAVISQPPSPAQALGDGAPPLKDPGAGRAPPAARSRPPVSARMRDQSKRLMDALRRERLAGASQPEAVTPRPPAAAQAKRTAEAPPAAQRAPAPAEVELVPERSPQRSSIPPSAPLESVNLAAVMPLTRRLTPPGGLPIYEIALDDIEFDPPAEPSEEDSLYPQGDDAEDANRISLVDVDSSEPGFRLPPLAPPRILEDDAGAGPAAAAAKAPPEPLDPMVLDMGDFDHPSRAASASAAEADHDERASTPPPPKHTGATLQHVPLFSELDPATLARLIQQVELREVEAGEVVYAAGDIADRVFVVVRGEVSILGTDQVELGTRRDSDFFGELGVINGAPRPTTAVAREASELLVIDRKLLSELAAEEASVLTVLLRFIRERLVHSLILTSPLFANYDASEAQALAARFHFLEVGAGAALLSPGQRADGLYILLSGAAELSVRGEVVQDLQAGDVFGEESLLNNTEPSLCVTTCTKCFALRLDAAEFREIILTHPPVLMYLSELAEARRSARAGLFSEPPPPLGRVDLS